MFGKRTAISECNEIVLSVCARLMKEQGIQGEADLTSSLAEDGLGLDSMARLELLRNVENEAGVTIPEKYWGGNKKIYNLDDLARIISKLAV